MVNNNLMYVLLLTFLFYLKAGAIGIFAIAQIGKFNIDDFKFKKIPLAPPKYYVNHIIMVAR